MPKQRKGEEREQEKEPVKTGRPSLYSEEIALTICDRIAGGESLRKICESEEIPSTVTILKWLSKYPEFVTQYAHARELQAEHMAEEILEIADEARLDTFTDDDGRVITNQEVIARSRLRVDARKWLASKLSPKKYGDKIDHTIGNPDGTPLDLTVNFVSPK